MPITVEQLESTLKTQWPDAVIKIEDLSGGCGAKFSAIIVTDAFAGVPLLERHRLVNSVLEKEMKEIHALTLKTWTQEQYAKNNKS